MSEAKPGLALRAWSRSDWSVRLLTAEVTYANAKLCNVQSGWQRSDLPDRRDGILQGQSAWMLCQRE